MEQQNWTRLTPPKRNLFEMSNKTLIVIVIAAILFIGLLFAFPLYRVYSAKMNGRADYERAEQNRKIKVLEAQAKESSAISLAKADSIRAYGIANAITIVSEKLKDETADKYLYWLWVNSLEGNQNIIYVPHGGTIPVMEAGRGSSIHPKPSEASKKQPNPLFDWNTSQKE